MEARTKQHHAEARQHAGRYVLDASDGVGIGDTFDTDGGRRVVTATMGCAPWAGWHYVDSEPAAPTHHADDGKRTIYRGATMIGWWSVSANRWLASKHADAWEADAFDMLQCTARGVLLKLAAATVARYGAAA